MGAQRGNLRPKGAATCAVLCRRKNSQMQQVGKGVAGRGIGTGHQQSGTVGNPRQFGVGGEQSGRQGWRLS